MRRSIPVVCTLVLAGVASCSRHDAPSSTQVAPSATPSAATVASAAHPRPTVPLARVGDGRAGSAIVLAKWADRVVAFVADEDEPAIRAVDVEGARELSVTPLASRPGQLLVAADGRLLATMPDEGTLASFRATDDPQAPLVAADHAATAAEPRALAETPDDATVLVASGWGHALESFDAASLARARAWDLPREPRAVATSADGATAFVAHGAASAVDAVDMRADAGAPAPKGISLDTGAWMGGDDEAGPNFAARTARGAYAIARLDGKRERLFVAHVVVEPGNPLVTTAGYGAAPMAAAAGGPRDALAGGQPNPSPFLMHVVTEPSAGTQTFEIDTIDPRKRELATGDRMPGVATETWRGGTGACLLPRAAAIDPAHAELLVACVGPDEVRAYDASLDNPTQVKMRRRWSVPAGAQGIAVDADHERAVVWSAFDGVVSVLSLAKPPKGAPAGVDAAPPPDPVRIAVTRAHPLPDDVARGRKLFFSAGDPRIAKDGRACASCHLDGRDDGLVWSSPQGPRQTIMLAGRVDHAPPFGWLGEHPTLQAHLAQTLKNLGGTGLEGAEIDALVAWLKVMPGPPASAPAPAGAEAAQEARGRELFEGTAADCSSCHVGKGGFTDHMVHEVGSATSADKSASFVTPSLRFLGGTAPYFHDGRYATLAALLKDPRSRMGASRQLAPDDLAALEAYLRTL